MAMGRGQVQAGDLVEFLQKSEELWFTTLWSTRGFWCTHL